MPLPPIPSPLQERLRKAGWAGEMSFDAINIHFSLGGWLVKRVEGEGEALELLRDCLQAGLPFYHAWGTTSFLDDLLTVAIDKNWIEPLWTMLFEEGLDINQRLEDGDTLLLLRTDYIEQSIEDDELFQFLWSKNPDLTIQNDAGWTVLLLMAATHPFEVSWLLERGANGADVVFDPITQEPRANVLSLLFEGLFNEYAMTSPDEVDVNATEALLRQCIDHGTDVHQRCAGQSLLHIAATYHPQALPFLIDQGIDLTLLNEEGETVSDILQNALDKSTLDGSRMVLQCALDKLILKMRESYDTSIPQSGKKSLPQRM